MYLLNAGNIPEVPIYAIFFVIELIALAVNVVCFIWSMCKIEDVKPREYWLKAFITYFALFLILNLVGIAYYYLGEVASDRCDEEGDKYGWEVDEDGDWVPIDGEREELVPMLFTHEECVAGANWLINLNYGIALVVGTPLMLWFLINIRDWRDKFFLKQKKKAEKAKKQAEQAEMMAARGLQMQTMNIGGVQMNVIQSVQQPMPF